MEHADLTPSACCQYCPHFQQVKASCNHEFRQTLRRVIREHPHQPCPIYRKQKTDAMQSLLDEMGSSQQ